MDSIHLPERSRQEEKCQGLLSAEAMDKKETHRELTNQRKSQWSHSPFLTPSPKKTRSRDCSHLRQSRAKPSSELTSLKLSGPQTKSITLFPLLPLYPVCTSHSLIELYDECGHPSPLAAPSHILSTLKASSHTCPPVYFPGT